jgi:hypothetical protein
MVAPLGGVGFGDGRPAAAIAGAEALFHPVDELGIGAWAVAELAAGSVFAPQIVLVPIKGRPPLFFDSEWFPPFDLHLELGAAWGGVGPGDAARLRPMGGVGLTSFFAQSLSFGLDGRVVGNATWDVVTVSLTYWCGNTRYPDEEE